MKRLNLFSITVILLVTFLVSQNVFAQRGKFRFECGEFKGKMMEKLNLTAEQKDAIEELRLKHQSEMIDLNSDIEKKKLAIKELMSKGNYSRDEYLSTVKAISDAKNNIAISMANHRMDIYELLTDEQRATFNQMGHHMGPKMNKMKHWKGRRDF